MSVRVALVGAGAIGEQHARALSVIDGAKLALVASRTPEESGRLARDFGVAETVSSLDEVLARPEIDAVILATPTQMHAAQAVQCMDAGKHVLVEIPLADNWRDARLVHATSLSAGVVAMVGHTSRYYPSHAWLHDRIAAGEFMLQQMDAQTYFMRRSNLNAKGEPRVWTDHLLWHHAAHTIDLFGWQAGRVVEVQAMQGPMHPELGIAMDMAILLRAETGALCTLSLSFNNDGPLGSTVRYIGDSATYVAKRLELRDGYGNQVVTPGADMAGDGVEVQDRDFIRAITQGGAPLTSVEAGFDTYRVIAEIAALLEGQRA